jgi:energy-coupling factor transporter ATP-binding protein EcfA2
MHPYLQNLLQCIRLEEKEQTERYSLNAQHSLKQLKAEGLALHPLMVTRKNFGYADYPEISFRQAFPPETHLLRDGAAIECFIAGEEPVKGILLGIDGNKGEFRLFAPDFPEWIEDDGVGLKLSADTRTTTIMTKVLQQVNQQRELNRWFELFHTPVPQIEENTALPSHPLHIHNGLNSSQQQAVNAMLQNEDLLIIHGPPGTGKTTTIAAGIALMVSQGKKILVSAPSNTATDHICKTLLKKGIAVLRVGNTSKTDEELYAYTSEGKLNNSKDQKAVRQLKIRAEEFRKMALKYKRNFGKAEREQRQLLLKEVKQIRQEIKQLQHYNEEKLYAAASVICGTPIGIYDAGLQHQQFDTVVIDEAGQCIEPLAWCIINHASKLVLAGDHLQLPPTVLSEQAAKQGLNRSVLEMAIAHAAQVVLLNQQYRMREAIAGFSSRYFYNNQVQTPAHLHNNGIHITFIDTAGAGYNETTGADGVSLQNEGELQVASQWMEINGWQTTDTAFLSPYNGQVTAAKAFFPATLRCSTIDSFQGQEKNQIILSLVRSNQEGIIGFLKDYRRMNVAITRAKEHLLVIGDSATIGADDFYSQFLEYAEKNGCYKSVWEYINL